MAAVLPFAALVADMPPSLRRMSRFEWGRATSPFLLDAPLLMCAYFATAAFVTFFVVTLVKKRRSATAWMAACSPALMLAAVLLFDLDDPENTRYYLFVLLVLAISAAAWVVSMVVMLWTRKFLKTLLFTVLQAAMLVLSVFALVYITPDHSPETSIIKGMPGETYADYEKRATRILEHLCPKCDTPMDSAYYMGRHWFCRKCGHGRKEYEEALKRGK